MYFYFILTKFIGKKIIKERREVSSIIIINYDGNKER